MSVDEAVEAGAGTAGVEAVSLPALAGRGVDAGEGTWAASRRRGTETLLGIGRWSPWGCVTVILVGGRESGWSGSTSVAGRFLLVVRAAGVSGEVWRTGLSSSASAIRGPEREARRVAMVAVGVVLRWTCAWECAWAWARASSRDTGKKLSLVCRSFEPRSRGRTALAMLSKLKIIRDWLGHFSESHCRACH